mmetsp:Transcript_12241/g.33958  ORF Transcript_12241/g.33958 Transcript_12241/m.33958 type:complete len:433 (-) Transcript_12241:39-1337(-)
MDAADFDPFGIQSNRDDSQVPKRPVLMAVDKKNSTISHHSQLYSERHAHYSGPSSGGGTKGRAGRFKSAESQQQHLLAINKSTSLDESLDPFGVGDFSEVTQKSAVSDLEPMSLERRLEAARNGESIPITLDPKTGQAVAEPSPTSINRLPRSGSRALPPKMSIKLTLYEEVSSIALRDELIASQIAVEGSAYAQVQCSDALKNAPFGISASQQAMSEFAPKVTIRPNPKFTSLEPISSSSLEHRQDDSIIKNYNNADSTTETYLVNIPKAELGYVPVVHYSFAQTLDHMPVLLERKVTIHETSCRIALQVRSKLTNKGDLKDFTLAVAIPEVVNSDSIEIVRGQGSVDGLKRLIKFKLAHLNKGESFMVSAQANLWKAMNAEEVRFPVLMRCSSTDDHISTVDFEVMEADGTPCSISVTKAHSFRLLHRLT